MGDHFPRSGSPDRLPEYLSVARVSAMLGVGRSTLYSWLSQGRFPAPVKLGRATRWCLSDLEKWLEEKAQGGAA
ncbi:helix-turn-helix domain-containing protein [Hydrogenophaga sp. NH-16]|uniref:helix-turn-helix transcriptional regulator n=1 Tax=Hydrogenophaga sp. NH-16 TaxID=2184519 RepID=UPI00240D3C67|nr:helix-turn-helix domain-containing protein [Hydrogenophaga sp. NH-16]